MSEPDKYVDTKKRPRCITVDDAIWDATERAAKTEKSNRSELIRRALRAYAPVRKELPAHALEEDDG